MVAMVTVSAADTSTEPVMIGLLWEATNVFLNYYTYDGRKNYKCICMCVFPYLASFTCLSLTLQLECQRSDSCYSVNWLPLLSLSTPKSIWECQIPELCRRKKNIILVRFNKEDYRQVDEKNGIICCLEQGCHFRFT